MCGIVGAVAERDVVPILMEGLRRLEYRGYDSAGIAVLNGTKHLTRLGTGGKVRMLDGALEQTPTAGKIGIAHTRWATHGVPSERNAHPHISRDGLAIVHNGIIENHEELRADLERRGYRFSSETDTEVIAHRVHYHLQTVKDLFKAVRATVAELEGAYALAVVSEHEPERLIVAREGRLANGRLLEAAFGPAAQEVLRRTQNVHIVACGTSFHAAACARYFIEQVAKIPCSVDIASEYRYRSPLVPPNSLFVTISQSGDTADTLAAPRLARQSGHLSSPAICTVPESWLVCASESLMLPRAGAVFGGGPTM